MSMLKTKPGGPNRNLVAVKYLGRQWLKQMLLNQILV